MNRSTRLWLCKSTLLAGLVLAALTALPSRGYAQSSHFSYYNPRTGMQYLQGYSMQGRNFSNYWSYAPAVSHSYRGNGASAYGYPPRYTITPSYAAPRYSRQSYGYKSSPRRSYCR